MKATLTWTINDFHMYEMVFGWSTYGKLACSYFTKNNKAFMLINGSKMSFFNCHKRFLPMDYKYKRNINDFFVHRVERDVVSPLPLGEELYDMMSEYGDIVFGFHSSKQNFSGFGLTYN
jgi:hypothetical protein